MGCGHFALSFEVPSDYQGPRGTAQNDKSLKSFISGAAPIKVFKYCNITVIQYYSIDVILL